jgi:hypothetical protein
MTKKFKKQSSNQTPSTDSNVMGPYIVDMDVLSYASDDDLRDRNRHLNEEKEQAFRSGIDSYLWEVELAYVHREMGIRSVRRVMHERFMKTNPEACYSDSFDSYSGSQVSGVN